MKHFFEVSIAVELGVTAAIILENIGYWVKQNEANENNYHNGHYWTYNSRKAYMELFPYMGERQLNDAFKKLIEGEYIISDNFNQSKLDRTLWYTLTKKGKAALHYDVKQDNIMSDSIPTKCNNGESQNEIMEHCKIAEAIPYINTDINNNINTDNKQTPQAAMPDKSGEIVTATDTLNATLKGSIASIDTSIASIKEEFEQLWAIYPNKQGKQHAYRAYERARKRKQKPVTYEQVKAGIEQYCEYIAAKGISKQYIKHGSTWFSGAEWESEYDLTPIIQTPTYYKQENQMQTDNSDTNNIFMKMLDEMRNEHDE